MMLKDESKYMPDSREIAWGTLAIRVSRGERIWTDDEERELRRTEDASDDLAWD